MHGTERRILLSDHVRGGLNGDKLSLRMSDIKKGNVTEVTEQVSEVLPFATIICTTTISQKVHSLLFIIIKLIKTNLVIPLIKLIMYYENNNRPFTSLLKDSVNTKEVVTLLVIIHYIILIKGQH